jgi:hypothetical protein
MHAGDDDALTPRANLYEELGRLLATLADEADPVVRTDVADEAFDVIAVLQRLDGARGVAHPRGLRLVDGGRAA